MSLLVVGSTAFDTIETPHGKAADCLGGSHRPHLIVLVAARRRASDSGRDNREVCSACLPNGPDFVRRCDNALQARGVRQACERDDLLWERPLSWFMLVRTVIPTTSGIGRPIWSAASRPALSAAAIIAGPPEACTSTIHAPVCAAAATA